MKRIGNWASFCFFICSCLIRWRVSLVSSVSSIWRKKIIEMLLRFLVIPRYLKHRFQWYCESCWNLFDILVSMKCFLRWVFIFKNKSWHFASWVKKKEIFWCNLEVSCSALYIQQLERANDPVWTTCECLILRWCLSKKIMMAESSLALKPQEKIEIRLTVISWGLFTH